MGRFINPDPLIQDTYFKYSYRDIDECFEISQKPLMDGVNWYRYCYNNPVNKTDSDGKVVDTIFDAASLTYDVYELQKNPRDVTNWMAFGTDLACTFIPFATGGGLLVRGLEKASDAMKSETLLFQALKGEGKALIGAGTDKVLGDAERLAAQYGGKASDYAKMTTTSETLSNGNKIQVHYYKNVETGKVYEFKTKITRPTKPANAVKPKPKQKPETPKDCA